MDDHIDCTLSASCDERACPCHLRRPAVTAPAPDAWRGLPFPADAVATAALHRRAQEADHWRTKYERQIKNSARLERERNEALQRLETASYPQVQPLREFIARLEADLAAARRERDERLSVAWRDLAEAVRLIRGIAPESCPCGGSWHGGSLQVMEHMPDCAVKALLDRYPEPGHA